MEDFKLEDPTNLDAGGLGLGHQGHVEPFHIVNGDGVHVVAVAKLKKLK